MKDIGEVFHDEGAQRGKRGADDADVEFHSGPGRGARIVPGNVLANGNDVEGV